MWITYMSRFWFKKNEHVNKTNSPRLENNLSEGTYGGAWNAEVLLASWLWSE